MSFRQRSVILYTSLLAIVSIAVVVVIIKNKKDEFEKIEAAVPGWLGPTGCAEIDVVKPSRNTGFDRWIGSGATTAEINCEYVSGGLEYARFKSFSALDVALHLRPHRARVCVFGRTLLEEEEFGNDAEELRNFRNFNVMCRNLHGTRY
jgi:hypothetical protein